MIEEKKNDIANAKMSSIHTHVWAHILSATYGLKCVCVLCHCKDEGSAQPISVPVTWASWPNFQTTSELDFAPSSIHFTQNFKCSDFAYQQLIKVTDPSRRSRQQEGWVLVILWNHPMHELHYLSQNGHSSQCSYRLETETCIKQNSFWAVTLQWPWRCGGIQSKIR